MTKVWRDAQGQVINIGEWDTQPETVATNPVPADVEGEEEPDAEGHYRLVWRNAAREVVHEGAWDFAPVQVARNPLPAGATCADEDVVTGWDGGRYHAEDPRRLG